MKLQKRKEKLKNIRDLIVDTERYYSAFFTAHEIFFRTEDIDYSPEEIFTARVGGRAVTRLKKYAALFFQLVIFMNHRKNVLKNVTSKIYLFLKKRNISTDSTR